MAKTTPLDITSTGERRILDFRRRGWKDIAVVGKYQYRRTRDVLPAHQHKDMLEICYCSKGEQVYEAGGRLHKVKGGECFVTHPGEWHGTGTYPEGKGELYWIILRIPGKGNGFLQFDNKAARAWAQQLKQLPRHFKAPPRMKILLDEIFDLYDQERSAFNQVELQLALAAVLQSVIKSAASRPTRKRSARLSQVDTYIRQHPDEWITLQQLADHTGLSLSRFKAWFKEEAGATPLDYIMKFKIEHARQLLIKTDMTIAEIAFETGFQNAQYFATVFKKYMGKTPSQARMR
ncbi:AraC family transcriptional regulator [Nostoc ellipsosporum NOK]|nr:AraC family transcriptional regulator [Nostoc ellipsosporum NOK]